MRMHGLGMVSGPFALLLGASTDLGPSHRDDTQLTVELRDSARPTRLVGWARGQGLSVRWQPGKNWAVVEGEADKVGSAFDVEVHDYRGQRGQLFYASPQQPSVPEEAASRGCRTRPDPELHPVSHVEATDAAA